MALLQYTGGTTGLPKGAMLSHGNLTSAVSIYDVWGKPSARATRRDRPRDLRVAAVSHLRADGDPVAQLERGNLISLHQRFDVEAVMRDIEVKRATAFPGVPTMWIAIASLPDLESRDLSSLVSCGSGGAPLPVEVARIFERKINMKLKSGWGMTETCSPGTAHPKEGPEKPGSIGLMLPGIEMDVVALDDSRKVLPPGEVGEIRIKGPNVTKGYWNRPKETAEAFVGDRFLTGDIGYMDSGRLFLSGRSQEGHDHLRRLQRLSADDRAGDLRASRGAGSDRDRHSRRLSRRGGEGIRQIARWRQHFTLEELKAFLSGKLGKHEIPAALDFVDELPRTSVGKLSRHELRNQQPSQPKQQQLATGGRVVTGAARRFASPWGRSDAERSGEEIDYRVTSPKGEGAHSIADTCSNLIQDRRIRWISASARKK